MYLLDTNILIAYIRLSRLYSVIESNYNLLLPPQTPLLSVVTEAEIRAFAEENRWGQGKRDIMNHYLGLFTIIPVPYGNLIENYVRVAEYNRRSGRAMGKNDIWIAATVMATGATLLSTDRDFDHLDPLLLTRQWIDPTLP